MNMTALVCIALAIFFEGRGEPDDGQYAIGATVINRAVAQHKRVCKVVEAPGQYSIPQNLNYEDVQALMNTPEGKKSLNSAQAVVYDRFLIALSDYDADLFGGVTHFHTVDSCPKWAMTMRFMTKIGNHRFYRPLKKGEASNVLPGSLCHGPLL